MRKYLPFTSPDGPTNETAFNAAHARIMQRRGLPNEFAKDWATPKAHPDNPWCAMQVEDEDLSVLTPEEQAAVQTEEQMRAAGWFPIVSPADTGKQPWWAYLNPANWWQ